MCELMRCKGLGVLRLYAKRIDILEVMRPKGVGIEAVEMGGRRDLTSVESTFGSGKR